MNLLASCWNCYKASLKYFFITKQLKCDHKTVYKDNAGLVSLFLNFLSEVEM